jgi:hypothetical protein
MKNQILLFVIGGLLIVAGVAVFISRGKGSAPQQAAHSEHTPDPHAHATKAATPDIPAFQTGDQVKNLAPTLAPAQFEGKAKEAYEVAKKIPETLAELPCYCHCDQAFGHKSLHSCYVDDHASHCAVCVDEALLAYKLQKEEKLTPAQVRERIIQKYSQEVY